MAYRKNGVESSPGSVTPRPRPPHFPRMVTEQRAAALSRRPQTMHTGTRTHPGCVADAGVSPTRPPSLNMPEVRAQTAPLCATRDMLGVLDHSGRHKLEIRPGSSPSPDGDAWLPRGTWDPIRMKLEDEFASLGCCRKQFRKLSGAVWRHAVELNQVVVNAVGQLGCKQPLGLMLQLWDMFLLMAETSLGKSFNSQLIATIERLHDRQEGLEAELDRAVSELDNAGVSVGLLRKGLMAARDELRAEKRQVTVYERANDGLMRTSTTVVDSLRAENKGLKEAISEFQRMPMRLSELQRENRQLQRQSGPERDSLLETLRETGGRVEQLQEELSQARCKAECQRAAAKEAAEEAEHLRNITETTKAQLEGKEQIVKILESDNRSLTQREKASALAARESERARQAAEQRINELNDARAAEAAQADERVAEAVSTASRAEQRLNVLDASTSEKIQEMDKQLQAIKAEKVLMGMRLAAAEARHRVQFGDKATVVNKLHLELEGMHETKNRYKRLHEDALREVEEVREAMAWRAAEWRMEREELEHEQLKAMDENRAYYELQLEERDRRIAELNGELQSVRHTSQAELEVTKREEQKLKRGVMQADATVKDLEKAVKEMREQEAYTSYDISRLTDALARKDAEQRDAKEEMAASIDILQKRVHTLTKELSNNSATLSHRMEELQNSRQQVLELEEELRALRGRLEEGNVRSVSRNLSRAESVRYVLADEGGSAPPHATFFEEKAHENEVQEGMLNMSAAYRAALRMLEEAGVASSREAAQEAIVDRVEEADLDMGTLTFAEICDKLGAAMLELGKLRREAEEGRTFRSTVDAESTKLHEDHNSRFLENQKLRVALADEEEKNRKLAEQVVKLWQARSKKKLSEEEEEDSDPGMRPIVRLSSLRDGGASRTRSDVGVVEGKAVAGRKGGRSKSPGGQALTHLVRRNTSGAASGLLQAWTSARSNVAASSPGIAGRGDGAAHSGGRTNGLSCSPSPVRPMSQPAARGGQSTTAGGYTRKNVELLGVQSKLVTEAAAAWMKKL